MMQGHPRPAEGVTTALSEPAPSMGRSGSVPAAAQSSRLNALQRRRLILTDLLAGSLEQRIIEIRGGNTVPPLYAIS